MVVVDFRTNEKPPSTWVKMILRRPYSPRDQSRRGATEPEWYRVSMIDNYPQV